MEMSWSILALVCPLIFLSGLVDSIAGGGGLISLPSYIMVGLPAHMAYGTNKFAACLGTSFSVARFMKNKKVHIKSAIFFVFAAIIGSYIGVRVALALDEKYLKICLLVLLPIMTIFIMTRKNFGEVDKHKILSDKKIIILSILSGLVIGAYDGFFGPGTGSFYILIYTGVMGFTLTTASGNAKIVNLASNVTAMITFTLSGKVFFPIAIPAALCGILGNWIGSGLAIKNGAKVIKPVFVAVLILLFLKISMDLFSFI